MPVLSVWMIRAALLHLGLGFTFGALLLFNKGVPLHPGLWALLPLHIEAVFVGWMVQLAMGVGYWILPRFHKYVDRDKSYDDPRGRVRLAWLAFALLNGGVLAVWASSVLTGIGVLAFAGRTMELLAAGTFALHAWPRIKPPGA